MNIAKIKNQVMETLNTLYLKRSFTRNIRKFLILFVTGVMFLISYTNIFAVTSSTITKPQNGDFSTGIYIDNDEKNKSVEISIFRGRMLVEPNLLVWQTIKEKRTKTSK